MKESYFIIALIFLGIILGWKSYAPENKRYEFLEVQRYYMDGKPRDSIICILDTKTGEYKVKYP